jgi:polyisoprenyl-phosphate glycosyltransferase
MKNKKLISIVTPCYNEEDSIQYCIDTVASVMKEISTNYDYEHIFSDNASIDRTPDILRLNAEDNKNIKILFNSHNVGPFLNNFNALSHTKGDLVVVFLPADLQDPPTLIPEMVKKIDEGNEIVLGVRNIRQESFILRILRKIFYFTMNIFSKNKVPTGAGEFMMVTKKVIDIIIESKSENPYIRGIVAQLNLKKDSIKYLWVKRKYGESKNSYSDLIDQAINAFVTMTYKPVRYITYVGFIAFCCSLIFLLFNIFSHYLLENKDNFSEILTLCFISFFGSLNLLFIGVVGEYILKINNKLNKSLNLKVIEKINF